MNKLFILPYLIAFLEAGWVAGKPWSSQPDGRIVGGSETDISEINYQLAYERNGYQRCGAAIISKTFAITAAHCNEGYPNDVVKIRAGSSKVESGGVLLNIKTIINHPKFTHFPVLDYDVALLEMETPFQLGPSIGTIQVTDVEPIDGNLLVSGWGDLREGSNEGSQQLMSVAVPVVDRKVCEEQYTGLSNVTDREICAGVAGKDTCQGDSGGPAVQSGFLVGITSSGYGCAREGYPGFYTNLAHPDIRDFIREVAKV